MAFTQEQIIQAADVLVARGETPTLAAVRAEVGGGSFTTISEALKVWRRDRQEERIRAEVVMIPAELQRAFEDAGRLVWAEATAQHAAKLAEERQTLEEAYQRYENDRKEAVEAADQIAAELEQTLALLEQERADLTVARQALTTAHQELEINLTHGRTLSAQLEERASQVAALEAELTRARSEVAATGEERGRLQGQLSSAEARQGSLQEELERARAALAAMQGDLRLNTAELAAAKELAATERAGRLALESDSVGQRDRISELQVQVAQLAERTAHLDDLRALLGSNTGPSVESPQLRKTGSV